MVFNSMFNLHLSAYRIHMLANEYKINLNTLLIFLRQERAKLFIMQYYF